MSVVVSAPVVSRAAAQNQGRYDRAFYGTMAATLALTVLAGFGPTYYSQLATGGPKATVSGGPFTLLVHLHGALFTAWVLLFIVQTVLVATHRVAVHRRLGVAGAVLAAGMVVVGTSTAMQMARRGGAPPGIDPLAFLAVPLFDMILFSGFVTAALIRRKSKETHKRLMLLAYISIIAAAMARLPGILSLGPLVFYGLAFVFVIAAAAYDRATRRRVHAVYVWGGALFAVSVPLRLALSTTSGWQSLARLITE
jgi:hypothetical protein